MITATHYDLKFEILKIHMLRYTYAKITLWGAVQCADSGCFWTLVTATLHSGGLPF